MTTSTQFATSSAPPVQQRIPPARNNLLASRRKPLAFTITQEKLTERVQNAFREFAGYGPDAAKAVQQAIGCSLGTAKNLLEGKSTPIGIYDARAMFAIPHYFALKAELAGLEMELDPRHQAKMAEFMRYCALQADAIFNSAEESAAP